MLLNTKYSWALIIYSFYSEIIENQAVMDEGKI